MKYVSQVKQGSRQPGEAGGSAPPVGMPSAFTVPPPPPEGAEGAPGEEQPRPRVERPDLRRMHVRGAVEQMSVFQYLSTLRESSHLERPELFHRKLVACSVVFDFSSDTCKRDKEAKRQALLEIVEYVNNGRSLFAENIMEDLVWVVGQNIFRSLPAKHRGLHSLYEPDDEEPALEIAWPHLQIIYEFFLRFIVSNDVDPKVAKRFIDGNFVLKLLELFDSEDPRERDYLKTILHRVYGKFMAFRSFIRKAIQNVFFKVVYETEVHGGVGELLEILGSIINGFALPLKDEHKDFLNSALIPLHKVKGLASFHQQLSYCMTQFVEKDPRLAVPIVNSMLKFWPTCITSKQVLFVNELEEILELTQAPEFEQFKKPLFEKVAECIMCPHFQVAERVLFLWNNDYLVKLINSNRADLFPVMIGPLYENSKDHWNTAVHGLTFNVLKLLMEADPNLFDECSAHHRAKGMASALPAGRDGKWNALRDNYTSVTGRQDVEEGIMGGGRVSSE